MKVRLVQQISGTRDGVSWPPPGTEVDLPDPEAKSMILGGTAVDASAPAGDTVLVSPAGVHVPGAVPGGSQPLVAVPVDAVSNPQLTRDALDAVAAGDYAKEVPPGVGTAHPSGLALDADGVDDNVKSEELAQEAVGGRVGDDEAPRARTARTTDPKSTTESKGAADPKGTAK